MILATYHWKQRFESFISWLFLNHLPRNMKNGGQKVLDFLLWKGLLHKHQKNLKHLLLKSNSLTHPQFYHPSDSKYSHPHHSHCQGQKKSHLHTYLIQVVFLWLGWQHRKETHEGIFDCIHICTHKCRNYHCWWHSFLCSLDITLSKIIAQNKSHTWYRKRRSNFYNHISIYKIRGNMYFM